MSIQVHKLIDEVALGVSFTWWQNNRDKVLTLELLFVYIEVHF